MKVRWVFKVSSRIICSRRKVKLLTAQRLEILVSFYPDIFKKLFKCMDTLGKKPARKDHKDNQQGYDDV